MKLHISTAMAVSTAANESLPLVGYRFHPTDDELLTRFLKPKLLGRIDYRPPIPEVKVCDYEPWDLPGLINPNSNDQVWYFFCPRDYKYLRSRRSNRTTVAGYWKSTGKPRQVFSKSKQLNGTKRTLVFYIREKPKSIRTKWIIHEYECALNSSVATPGSFVLCKLKLKPDENTDEGEPVHTDIESDFDSQNLMVNSSCDEQESSIHMCSDSNGMTDMSIHEKGEWACLETITNFAGDEDILYHDLGFGNPDEMAAISTCARDFEGQNPHQKTDISATEEGECTEPTASDNSDCANCTDVSSAEEDPLLNFIDWLSLDELTELVKEDNWNFAFYQMPMSPNESSSYYSFCADGEEHEIGLNNDLFSYFSESN